LAGFRGSLTRVLKAFIKKENAKKAPTDLLGEDVREGIVAIISVKVPDPNSLHRQKKN
jgi:DNA gyrase subunit B